MLRRLANRANEYRLTHCIYARGSRGARSADLILEASIESKTIGCISSPRLGMADAEAGWPWWMFACFSALPGPKFVHCYWMLDAGVLEMQDSPFSMIAK